jgi:hypothetical protein
MKRTPMKRGTSQLARTGWLAVRTAINPVSAKRARENRDRTKALKPLRAAQDWCSRCGVAGVGLDAHELLSRGRGGSITDLDNIVLLCRPCHTWVTENPAAAEAAGWAHTRKRAA